MVKSNKITIKWQKNLVELLFSLFKKKNFLKNVNNLQDSEINKIIEMLTSCKKKILGGRLIILSGPSGVGKGAIQNIILKNKKISKQLLATTRAMRPGEKNKKQYYFYSLDDFIQLIAKNNFIDVQIVHGNLYGLPKKESLEKINSGKTILIEISVQMANSLKKKLKFWNKKIISIFILPPSYEELRRRIVTRTNKEKKSKTKSKSVSLSEKKINKRLQRALCEIEESAGVYDHYVVNEKNKITQTADKIMHLINQGKNFTN